MKALVISGGGSKGAFAGGIAEYLIRIVVYPMNYLWVFNRQFINASFSIR
jgi:hypothetical protein